jgi:hypothetical protein
MAGYIFNLNSDKALVNSIKNGVYSTNLTIPSNEIWKIPHEGTFADYLSMQEGDNVYFFIDRKIYGIGELVNVGFDCKYLNFPKADYPIQVVFKEVKDSMLMKLDKSSINNRCICTFKPSPNFFKQGIDMDDVLSSKPGSFRMLRAFWKLSFLKIDDEENKALKDTILKTNEEFINSKRHNFKIDSNLHKHIRETINSKYKLNSDNILSLCSNNDFIKHEMALEAGIIDFLSNNKNSIFGAWDYLSHQVIASPFKPIDYMDKMDIFGYKFIQNFDTISKFLLIEIKKDKANVEAIDQIMKYVDWVNQEYSFGDYSMINAFVVAYNFPEEVVEYRNKVCKRNYIKGRRPAVSDEWSNVRLISYSFDNNEKKLKFKEIE